jgi:hypothetical protein
VGWGPLYADSASPGCWCQRLFLRLFFGQVNPSNTLRLIFILPKSFFGGVEVDLGLYQGFRFALI